MPDSPITVWVDAAREPAVTAFKEANPDVPIKFETYDGNAGGSGSFQSKITLMDQAGEGWPDVVFSTQQNDAIWASKETPNGEQGFAAPLNKGFLDQDFLDGFVPGANDITTIDGSITAFATTWRRRSSTTTSRCSTSSATRSPPRGRSTANSATSSRPSTPATSSAAWATRS